MAMGQMYSPFSLLEEVLRSLPNAVVQQQAVQKSDPTLITGQVSNGSMWNGWASSLSCGKRYRS